MNEIFKISLDGNKEDIDFLINRLKRDAFAENVDIEVKKELPLVWANMSLKDLIASMRKIATESDNIGKSLEPQHYKRREYFDAANKLRDAAYALEYVIS